MVAANTHRSPELSVVYPFINLLLPVLLVANLAYLLYWAIRWKCWLFIPVLAIAGSWSYLDAIYQFGSKQSATHAGKTLTVATYNVDSFQDEGMGYSCKSIARYMKEQQVDVVCMQEFGTNKFFTLDSVKHAFAAWPYVYIPSAEKDLLQLALFSKYPLADSALITYGNSNNCSLWCDIEVHGKRIRIFNNHLQTTNVSQNRRRLEKEMAKDELGGDLTEQAALRLVDAMHQNFVIRARQADTLRTYIEQSPYPLLVCGDLNSVPSSYTYHKVKGENLLDGFQTCGKGYMYTYRYLKRVLRIDYIFHSKELKGLKYYSPDMDYSDHNPVLMQVELPQ